jgi:hypothetical protein
MGLWPQTEHVAMGFGVRSGRLFRFYWENLDVMPEALVNLSDLHIDAILDGGERLFCMVATLEYDLCVLTGDYRFDTCGVYDDVMVGMERLMEVLSFPDGVGRILGNHDVIEMVPGLKAMGIIMLLNESLTIERGRERIRVVGVDDAHYYEVADLTRAMTGVDVSAEAVVLVVQ